MKTVNTVNRFSSFHKKSKIAAFRQDSNIMKFIAKKAFIFFKCGNKGKHKNRRQFFPVSPNSKIQLTGT